VCATVCSIIDIAISLAEMVMDTWYDK
jgi:hypothetical protein